MSENEFKCVLLVNGRIFEEYMAFLKDSSEDTTTVQQFSQIFVTVQFGTRPHLGEYLSLPKNKHLRLKIVSIEHDLKIFGDLSFNTIKGVNSAQKPTIYVVLDGATIKIDNIGSAVHELLHIAKWNRINIPKS